MGDAGRAQYTVPSAPEVWLLLILSLATAAPVACDPLAAAQIVDDARISRDRLPFSHPELLPGIALADPNTPDDLRATLRAACAATGADLSLRLEDRHESRDWTAHVFALIATTEDACATRADTTLLSVVSRADGALAWRALSRLEPETAPLPGCAEPARWNAPAEILDAAGPLTLRLERSCAAAEGAPVDGPCPSGEPARTALVARLATPDGWFDQVIADPAPPRARGDVDGAGPLWEVVHRQEGTPWIVAHHDRELRDGACTPRPGPVVWQWTGAAWTATRDREALGLLGREGLSRMADQEGWYLVLAQDAITERRRFQAWQEVWSDWTASFGGEVHTVDSVLLPRFNPGHVVLVSDPWTERSDARDALRGLRPRGRAYVKLGWEPTDACDGPPRRRREGRDGQEP